MQKEYSVTSRYEIMDKNKKEDVHRIVHSTSHFRTFPEAYAHLMELDNRLLVKETAEKMQADRHITYAVLSNRKGSFIAGKRLLQGVPDVLPDGVYLTVNLEQPEWKKHAGEMDISWSATKPYSWSQDKYLLETVKNLKERTTIPVQRNARRTNVGQAPEKGRRKKK